MPQSLSSALIYRSCFQLSGITRVLLRKGNCRFSSGTVQVCSCVGRAVQVNVSVKAGLPGPLSSWLRAGGSSGTEPVPPCLGRDTQCCRVSPRAFGFEPLHLYLSSTTILCCPSCTSLVDLSASSPLKNTIPKWHHCSDT